MVSSLARRLRDRLEAAAVLVEPERRGRDPQPGRPDSVLWLRPDTVAVGRLVPLLAELEGARSTTASYHASESDIAAFAARHDPEERPMADDFRYHLSCPTMDPAVADAVRDEPLPAPPMAAPAPVTVPVDYERFAVPSATVTGDRAATDADLHRALRRRFEPARSRRTTPNGFSSGATVRTVGVTEIVDWTVDWRLPGPNKGTVTVPFIVQAGPSVEHALSEVLAPVTVPTMAVIDRSPPAYEDTLTYETGIRFPTVSPANVVRSPSGSDKVK